MGIKSGPRIVKEGLVLDIDAAVSRSYSGSGLTAYGLVGGIGGTLVNGTGFGTTNNGYFIFDGTNDYANCGNNSSLSLSSFTASAWVYPRDLSSRRNILSKEQSANWVLAVGEVANKVTFWINNSIWVQQDSISNIGLNSWTHILVTYDNTTKKIYINGIFDSEQNASNIVLNSSTPLLISNNASNFTTYFFNGNISQVQIYNRVLTAQEILQNYNATKGRYR